MAGKLGPVGGQAGVATRAIYRTWSKPPVTSACGIGNANGGNQQRHRGDKGRVGAGRVSPVRDYEIDWHDL